MFYLARIKDLLKVNTFFVHPVLPFLIEKNKSVNLDNKKDLEDLKRILKKK